MSDEIHRALGRIEGAIDAIRGDTSEIKQTLDNHSKRLNSVEGFKIQILTIAGLVGAGMAFVWDIVKNKLGA
jgi:hypothetical protein